MGVIELKKIQLIPYDTSAKISKNLAPKNRSCVRFVSKNLQKFAKMASKQGGTYGPQNGWEHFFSAQKKRVSSKSIPETRFLN